MKQMASVVAIAPIGLLLLFTGLLVNFIQLLTLILVLPFSRWAYRWINYFLMDAFWSQIVWLLEWWGRLEVRIYADPGTMKAMGTESAIAMCNHRSDVDWAIGWVLAQRCGCLGSTRALMKKSASYVPIIGWSMWFSEYIFLARKWESDKTTMEAAFKKLRDFPRPMWMALFAEGTRFTEEKLKQAQEFATTAGLPVPKNTLVPRTKGFVMCVENMREFVPAIYDITVVVPKGVPPATFTNLLKRRATEVQVQIRRIETADLPSDPEGLAKWCRDSFVRKDEMLEEHKKTNTFKEEQFVPSRPSLWPLAYTTLWALLVAVILGFLSAYLSRVLVFSLNTIYWVVAALAIVVIFVQKLVAFTKSEHSTPLPKARALSKANKAE